MTARKELAVRGQDTGWWDDDDPSALRREDYDKKRVNNNGRRKSINNNGKNGEDGAIHGPEQCLQTFEEVIGELNRREKNNNLKYNDENVDLIILAIKKSHRRINTHTR